MKFKKIKILGFKSFVDQTDIDIEAIKNTPDIPKIPFRIGAWYNPSIVL